MARDELKLGMDSADLPPARSPLTLSVLTEALNRKALRWITEDPNTIVIPRATYKEMMLDAPFPDGVEMVPSPLRGRRVAVREKPNGFANISARWPEAQLETKRSHMIGCAIRGQADLRISNYILRCGEGNFILIPSGIPHPDGTTPHLHDDPHHEKHCDILWFLPMNEFLKCWICRSENGKHSVLPTVYLKRASLRAHCDEIFEELEDRTDFRTRVRQGLLIAMIASILQEIEEGRYFRWLPTTEVDAPVEEADPIKRAQAYVRQHIAEQLTLDRVSRYCYMSRSQFAKVFHDETGVTFHRFVTNCRVEEALLRLRTSKVQTASIARHVGLKPRHFNHLIRQQTGLSPGDYRKQNWEERGI
jgi:AraC-like DNA-binding protein